MCFCWCLQRYRFLAAKARREGNAVSGDPIAARLIELAEKWEGDPLRDASYRRCKTKRLHLVGTTEIPERPTEGVKDHDGLLDHAQGN